jgi:endonuclease/exonuclease/phosphatase family metal-dependent hydrolase
MNLVLISSNIRFDNPEDGANAWPHRRDLLKDILLSHDPHIIATQEGRRQQLKDFAGLLNHFEIIDNHREWIHERMYPSFFIKKDTFNVLSSNDLWLSETPHLAGSFSFGSAFPRLMTWMHIRPNNTNQDLLIVNTHLDHIKSHTRMEQTKVLIHEINKIKHQNSKLIIMGDFNDGPQSEVRNYLNKSFPDLNDSWGIHNKVEESSHHSFNGENPNGARIDWILADKEISIEECFLEKKSMNGKYPSDHFPVICKIKL